MKTKEKDKSKKIYRIPISDNEARFFRHYAYHVMDGDEVHFRNLLRTIIRPTKRKRIEQQEFVPFKLKTLEDDVIRRAFIDAILKEINLNEIYTKKSKSDKSITNERYNRDHLANYFKLAIFNTDERRIEKLILSYLKPTVPVNRQCTLLALCAEVFKIPLKRVTIERASKNKLTTKDKESLIHSSIEELKGWTHQEKSYFKITSFSSMGNGKSILSLLRINKKAPDRFPIQLSKDQTVAMKWLLKMYIANKPKSGRQRTLDQRSIELTHFSNIVGGNRERYNHFHRIHHKIFEKIKRECNTLPSNARLYTIKTDRLYYNFIADKCIWEHLLDGISSCSQK